MTPEEIQELRRVCEEAPPNGIKHATKQFECFRDAGYIHSKLPSSGSIKNAIASLYALPALLDEAARLQGEVQGLHWYKRAQQLRTELDNALEDNKSAMAAREAAEVDAAAMRLELRKITKMETGRHYAYPPGGGSYSTPYLCDQCVELHRAVSKALSTPSGAALLARMRRAEGLLKRWAELDPCDDCPPQDHRCVVCDYRTLPGETKAALAGEVQYVEK